MFHRLSLLREKYFLKIFRIRFPTAGVHVFVSLVEAPIPGLEPEVPVKRGCSVGAGCAELSEV